MAKSSFAAVDAADAVVTEGAPERVWSEQSLDIFGWFSGWWQPAGRPTDLIVNARAGSGKTTNICEGVSRAHEDTVAVFAFNTAIAKTMQERITRQADVRTLHSKGMQTIGRKWRGIPIEAKRNVRADSLTNMVCAPDTPKQIKRLVSTLHTKGREISPFDSSVGTLTRLALQFDCVPDDAWKDYSLESVVEAASMAVQVATEDAPDRKAGVDYADMIFLPLVKNLLRPDYELVVVDEFQDCSMAQVAMTQQLSGGRLCYFGDLHQSIYQWRGAAGATTLAQVRRERTCADLPLTVTYRCSQAIVGRAQRLVPDITAHPSNPEGVVDSATYDQMLRQAGPGDYILSRINAPLVLITLKLLQQGKRARMAGRDIGRGIKDIIDRLHASTFSNLERSLDAWESKMVSKYAAYGETELVDRCRDQAATIRYILVTATSFDDLHNRIDWLFTDTSDADQILCSSIHKAKGQEADRVWLLQETLYRRGVTEEERYCEYVAITRAKSHLTIVEGVPNV